ncbi:hypothetical protein DPEC_G00194210 [Dallia pectoralis]|uniref:Uncharacterized protein n=1 Tax=Dallia pectoralis TaxID=75939 RepID=A0ACC2G726_DALPE|nr:hypothetical protein DPEC_G00194210 [Dallia pectoralis]
MGARGDLLLVASIQQQQQQWECEWSDGVLWHPRAIPAAFPGMVNVTASTVCCPLTQWISVRPGEECTNMAGHWGGAGENGPFGLRNEKRWLWGGKVWYERQGRGRRLYGEMEYEAVKRVGP